jgi:hypothetical protein
MEVSYSTMGHRRVERHSLDSLVKYHLESLMMLGGTLQIPWLDVRIITSGAAVGYVWLNLLDGADGPRHLEALCKRDGNLITVRKLVVGPDLVTEIDLGTDQEERDVLRVMFDLGGPLQRVSNNAT